MLVFNCLRLFVTVWVHVWDGFLSFETVCVCGGGDGGGTVLICLGQFGAVWNNLGLFGYIGTVWGSLVACLGLVGTVWVPVRICLGLCGTVWVLVWD